MVEWLLVMGMILIGTFGILVVIGGSREEAEPHPRPLPIAMERGEGRWRKTGEGHLQARCTAAPVVRESRAVRLAELHVEAYWSRREEDERHGR